MLKWKRRLLIDFNNCRVTTPCRRYQSPQSGPTAWEQREDLARGSRDTTGARAAPPPQNLTGLSLFCVTALLLVPASACHGTGICLAIGIPSPEVLCHLGVQAWPMPCAGAHLGHIQTPGYTQGRDVQGWNPRPQFSPAVGSCAHHG